MKRVNASGADDEGDYEVVLQVSPQGAGTVEGAGMYDENDTAHINAIPAKGYKFLKWSDNVETAERNIAITDDMSLIAIFEKDGSASSPTENPTQYKLTVTSANASQGSVTGGGTYNSGASATIKATPASGYQFDKWSDGSTSAQRTITVTKDQTLTATFKVVESGEGGGGGNDNEDDYSVPLD